jgi:SnoaL-like domain
MQLGTAISAPNKTDCLAPLQKADAPTRVQAKETKRERDHQFRRLDESHLTRVFGERDAGRRRAALEELYTADAKLYEPDSVFTGRDAICGAVEALIARLPPTSVFTPVGIAVGHHGLGRLAWRAAPPGGAAVVTGTDVVQVEAGRIKSLHVLLDPEPR